MKRKVKKFAGDEGSVVRTRTDKEFEEDSKSPYGRYMPKTKEYTFDEAKEKLSGLFGGKKEDTSKFDELESVKKTKTLEEQIGRKAEPKEEPRRKFSDYNKTDKASNVSEEDAPSKVEKAEPAKKARKEENVYPGPNDKRKTQPESTIPKKDKKSLGEDVKPAPAKPTKEASKALPGDQKDRSKPLAFKQEETTPSKYEDVTSKKDLGSQGSFKMNTNKPVTRYRKKEEDAPEVKVPKSKMDYEPEAMPKAASKALQDDTQYKTKYGDFSFQKGFKKDEDKKEKKTRSSADIRAGRYKSGGSISSASKRADGIAARGKTRGKIY